MQSPFRRSHSRYSRQAITLLGRLIRAGRIERKLSAGELATRAGISRSLLYRIEGGDPSCSIGSVFETAAIVGVPLFEEDRPTLKARLADTESRLVLLPKSIRSRQPEVKDDF